MSYMCIFAAISVGHKSSPPASQVVTLVAALSPKIAPLHIADTHMYLGLCLALEMESGVCT